MNQLCFCSARLLNINDCAWAVNGQPCCSAACFSLALAAQGEKERARAARDVPVGTSWAFHEHRTLAEVGA